MQYKKKMDIAKRYCSNNLQSQKVQIMFAKFDRTENSEN